MQDPLRKNIVLVLNRNWQAINTVRPVDVFGQMAKDVATGLDIQGENSMVPIRWEDWIQLPVRKQDFSIGTPHGRIRVPTVVVMSRYDRVPLKRPKLSLRNLWIRDQGRCQYTGRTLKHGEGNIDHVTPQSRGGETSWENCVLSDKQVNQKKADRTPKEAGLKLIRQPEPPRELPVTWYIRNEHEISDWNHFLPKQLVA